MSSCSVACLIFKNMPPTIHTVCPVCYLKNLYLVTTDSSCSITFTRDNLDDIRTKYSDTHMYTNQYSVRQHVALTYSILHLQLAPPSGESTCSSVSAQHNLKNTTVSYMADLTGHQWTRTKWQSSHLTERQSTDGTPGKWNQWLVNSCTLSKQRCFWMVHTHTDTHTRARARAHAHAHAHAHTHTHTSSIMSRKTCSEGHHTSQEVLSQVWVIEL